MIACDVNVLVHAFNADYPEHEPYRGWVHRVANGPEPFGLSSVARAGSCAS